MLSPNHFIPMTTHHTHTHKTHGTHYYLLCSFIILSLFSILLPYFYSAKTQNFISGFFTMGEKKEKDKDNGGVVVVLKADIHCDGCASKIVKTVRSFDGVDTVTIDGQKVTVVGKVDPAKLREKIEQKTHKKVELVSPPPKKDENDGGKKEKKKESTDKNSNDQKTSKEKEPPVTTAILKLHLHCDGCIDKIYKTITKTKGYKDMKIDTQKDLVTVTGAMDMKSLAEILQKKLKREVAIAPPKKDGENKEKGGGGGGDAGKEKTEGNKNQAAEYLNPFMFGPVVNAGEPIQYNPYAPHYTAPQIFSDENPNSCTVM